VREIFLRVVNVRGFWGYFLPLDLTMSTSMLYELAEWATSVVFGGDLGQSYLGTQGDEWDAHKDMALASLGRHRDVHHRRHQLRSSAISPGWVESFRVKHKAPLARTSCPVWPGSGVSRAATHCWKLRPGANPAMSSAAPDRGVGLLRRCRFPRPDSAFAFNQPN
jgi:hypothetical protein